MHPATGKNPVLSTRRGILDLYDPHELYDLASFGVSEMNVFLTLIMEYNMDQYVLILSRRLQFAIPHDKLALT